MSGKSALKLLDDASAAIQSSRDQLQHALDHARQGITVFDNNLALTAWNREFADLFALPPSMMRVGVGLDEIVRFNAARGAYGPGRTDDLVAERLESLLNHEEPIRLQAPSLAAGCWRSARRACPTAASSPPTPTSPRRCWPKKTSPRPTSGWSAACASAPPSSNGSTANSPAPRPRRRRRTSPRRASSPPPATTSCSRSTRRGSTPVR